MGASSNSVALWVGKKIPFQDLDSHPAKQYILDAMSQIEQNSDLWFCSRGNEPNYIYFTDDPNSRNGSHTVGMPSAGAEVNIKDDGWWALHELGHVVGLIHEQSRSDSQTYLQTFYKTNQPITLPCVTIPADATGVVDPNNRDMAVSCSSINLTDFDRVSVMQYAKDMGLIAGDSAPSMIWRADSILELGADNRRLLSSLDIEGINKLYKSSTSGWSAQSHLDGVGTRTKPALAPFGALLYAAWNGYSNDGIYYASFDGTRWSPQSRIQGVGTTCGPALAVYRDKLYAAWNGYHDDGIFYASFDGSGWSDQSKIEGVATRTSPALGVFEDKLYALWNGYHNDGLFYASFDGSSWSDQSKIDGVATVDGPALATFQDRLYAVWNGYHDDGIFYATFDGSSWSTQTRASQFGTFDTPAFAPSYDVYAPSNPALLMTWRGSGDQGIWWASLDPSTETWSGQGRTPYGTNTGVSMSVYQGVVYMAWCGSGNDGVWWARFMPA